MTRRFAREILGLDIDAEREGRAIFVGDSPNDAPMFGFFPLACGVSGVRAFADEIETPGPLCHARARAAAASSRWRSV